KIERPAGSEDRSAEYDIGGASAFGDRRPDDNVGEPVAVQVAGAADRDAEPGDRRGAVDPEAVRAVERRKIDDGRSSLCKGGGGKTAETAENTGCQTRA